MRLAADPITVEIAGEAYELRPTLRAATRLARRYGDFKALYQRVIEDHVGAITDTIREGSGNQGAAADFVTACDLPGIRSLLESLKLPLLRYVLALAGHDDDAPASSGKPIPFADYHAALFRIGTGWLGWSPKETWDATPAEILAARDGRTELISEVLKAIFGAPGEQVAQSDHLRDPNAQLDRAAFAALKNKIAANVR